jgi:hypothetical protein
MTDAKPPKRLPGFIHIDKKKGGAYAVYCKKTFVKDGKVFHEREYLGRVIDQEKGLYHNRKRGYFTFDLSQGYGELAPDALYAYIIPQNTVLQFGDVWLFDQILKQIGLDKVLESLIPNKASTVKTLVALRLLNPNRYDYAEEWYRTSYAKILYPNASVASKIINKHIALLGQKYVYNNFFYSYLPIILIEQARPDKTSFNVLIDRNNVLNNYSRLIYVIDKNTMLPIYFYFDPDINIDNLAVKNINFNSFV